MQTCLAVLALVSTVASPAAASDAPNPVRRVITMLQVMQKKVEEEGQQQQVLFDKYMCFCQTSLRKLNSDIDDGKDTVPQLESTIEEAVGFKANLENRVSEARAERADATKTLEEASSLRYKENKDFIEENDQKKVDIKSLKMAIDVMAKASGGFLQMSTSLTATIRRLVSTSADLSTSDRDVVTSFLAESQNDQDGSSDGMSESSVPEITGILKGMLDTMKQELAQLVADENNGVKQFESLKTAKESQTFTLDKEIKGKQDRLGKVGMQMVEDRQKLAQTQKALEANKKLEASLSTECKARHEEYNTEATTRSEELLAISDTIVIMNNDVAAHLFRKALPTGAATSLLQTQASPKQLKGDALDVLRSALPKGKTDPRLDFVALALRSKKTSFTGVLKMIDDMVVLLNKEQKDDVDKKQYCESEMAKTDDEKKELNQAITDLTKAMEQTTQKLQTADTDIKAKEGSIEALDNQVAEATKQRKEEHQDYTENLAANNAAKDILGVAKERLGKFYNVEKFVQIKVQPKSQPARKTLRVKTVPKDKGSLSALFDQGAFSFLQTSSEADPTYKAAKKRQDGNTVVTLLNTIIADIEKSVKEITRSEKEAQFEYQQAMEDSAEKRAGDAKAISELESVKAEAETDIQKLSGSVKAKTKESEGKATYLKELHKQCDSLLEHFKARRTSRTNEIDALQKAKAVLTSADADFLQLSTRTWRGLRLSRGHA